MIWHWLRRKLHRGPALSDIEGIIFSGLMPNMDGVNALKPHMNFDHAEDIPGNPGWKRVVLKDVD